MSDSYIALLTR